MFVSGAYLKHINRVSNFTFPLRAVFVFLLTPGEFRSGGLCPCIRAPRGWLADTNKGRRGGGLDLARAEVIPGFAHCVY